MKEEQKDRFFDLLTSKAAYGLDADAERELSEFDLDLTESELLSFEQAAAAISMMGIDTNEQMPAHLYARIADEAEKYVRPATAITEPVISQDGKRPGQWFGWLGWAVAAAACVALAVNIFVMPSRQPEIAQTQPKVEIPRVLSPAERREEMLRAAPNMVKAEWAPGNVKEIKSISGDVVWSDEMQSGYLRFRGLPANDPGKETYQLWIFDKTQDKATPIDGGTFDVPANGEIVIPINARLRPSRPEMFAITIEKPGGVVVSKREKIVALAKVIPQSS
jgi:hypothetical protein